MCCFTEDSISECDSISRGTQYKHPKGGSLFDIKTIKPTFTATEVCMHYYCWILDPKITKYVSYVPKCIYKSQKC